MTVPTEHGEHYRARTMTTLPTVASVTVWAREHGEHYRATVALDNYEPVPRETAYMDVYRYSTDHVQRGFVIDGGMALRDAPRIILLMDDGATVRPYYVAAWHPDGTHLIAHPFPVNVNEDGSQRMRPDGRAVDFSTWMVGPGRAYHLKLRRVEEDES